MHPTRLPTASSLPEHSCINSLYTYTQNTLVNQSETLQNTFSTGISCNTGKRKNRNKVNFLEVNKAIWLNRWRPNLTSKIFLMQPQANKSSNQANYIVTNY